MSTNRYRIIRQPQRGGMSSVYRAKDLVLERDVAIKEIIAAADLRRLKDEIKSLMKLRSRHVVQIYDLTISDENRLQIVQEFVEGEDLFHDSSKPQSKFEYLKLIWQICSGISDIHKLNIIHRDIKPNNMKIDKEGIVKIFDFGLSREQGEEAQTQGFVGTLGFAAPELFQTRPNFTCAVDTYAFGATALFLAHGDLPDELKHFSPHKCQENYFTTSAFSLPKEISTVLHQCLSSKPDERPKMGVVRDVLSKHLLFDKHRALLVYAGTPSYLDAKNRTVKLRAQALGEISINYDGLNFIADDIDGSVYINNRLARVGDPLPGACVITLGAPEHRNGRIFVTVDLSHPEVVL